MQYRDETMGTSIHSSISSTVRRGNYYPIDVRALNGSPLSFRYHVIKEGMLLMVKDDDLRSDFQEATLSGYFDFAPYRTIYLKERTVRRG